jgi:hypothetical protein
MAEIEAKTAPDDVIIHPSQDLATWLITTKDIESNGRRRTTKWKKEKENQNGPKTQKE